MAQSNFTFNDVAITGTSGTTITFPSSSGTLYSTSNPPSAPATTAGVRAATPIQAKQVLTGTNSLIPIYTSPTGYDTAIDSIYMTSLNASTNTIKLYLTNATLDPQKYVAISGSTGSTAAYSIDGITWTATNLPQTVANGWYGLAYGNSTFVAIGYGTTAAASSTNGITWTLRTMPVVDNWFKATYGNGLFVAIAYSSTNAASSTDGITWTLRTMPLNSYWYGITYGNGLFVATSGATTTTIAVSTDGITWTARTLPANTTWKCIAYGNGVFTAPSYGYSNGAYSTDGITWTAMTVLSPAPAYVSIAYGSGAFVAVPWGDSKAAYSTNGINWTLRTMPAYTNWQAITYGNGLFVAVADTYTSAASSTDGITWTLRTLPSASYWINAISGHIQDSELIYRNAVLNLGTPVFIDANKYDPIFVPSGYSLIAQSTLPNVNVQISGEKWINS